MVETSWFWRRWAVFGTLGFCAWAVGYLTMFGADTALARDIVSALSLLAGITVGSYIGGGAWDDLNRMKHGRFDDVARFDRSPPPSYNDAPVRRDPGGEQ